MFFVNRDKREGFALKQAVSMKDTLKRTALGAGVSLLCYLALLALISWLIVRGAVGEGRITSFVWAAALLASFAGLRFAARRPENALVVSLGGVLVLWAVILLLGFIGGDTLATARSAWLAIPLLLGGTLAYLVRPGAKGKKKGKRARRVRK